MSRGPAQVRGFGHVGVGLGSSLGSRQVGGGTSDNIRRALARSTGGGHQAAAAALNLTFDTAVGEGSGGSPSSLDTTLTGSSSGLWVISWHGAAIYGAGPFLLDLTVDGVPAGDSTSVGGGCAVSAVTLHALTIGATVTGELTTDIVPDSDFTLTCNAYRIPGNLP